jgi:hypothetical protein
MICDILTLPDASEKQLWQVLDIPIWDLPTSRSTEVMSAGRINESVQRSEQIIPVNRYIKAIDR